MADIAEDVTDIWSEIAKHKKGSAKWSKRGRDIGKRETKPVKPHPMLHFMHNHPSTYVAPAIGLGVMAARPIHHVSQAAGSAFEGDPDYFHKLTMGGLVGGFGLGNYTPGLMGPPVGFGATITSEGNSEGFTSEGNYGYSVNPDPDQALRMSEQVPGTNPNGSLIFGLYNSRLR